MTTAPHRHGWPPPLSSRLRAVADQIPKGARLADIGCDHALLPITLLLEGSLESAIGIDVHRGPLQTARRHADRAGVALDLRLGSGLAPLGSAEATAISIAGMGGARICQLLAAAPSLVRELEAVVVQPNTDWAQVRRFAIDAGLRLVDESMVTERSHHYVVMHWSADAGARRTWDELDIALGPLLRRRRTAAYLEWLVTRQAELTRLLGVVSTAQTQSDARRHALAEELDLVTRALQP